MKTTYRKIILEQKETFKSSKKLSTTETYDYQQKRNELFCEINKNKVEIDRSVFKKDTLEKISFKKAKKEYLLTNGTPDYVKEVNKTILIMEANPMICGNLIFKK